jgi:two-component system response regulator DevR
VFSGEHRYAMGDEEIIQCIVGDDHEMLRRGLVGMLDAEEDIRVVGQGATAGNVLRLAGQRSPDVVVVDVRLPDGTGIELCRALAEEHPSVAVLLYTGYEDPDLLESALEAGARGYLLKTGPPQGVVHAVRMVHQGHRYIDPALAPIVLRRSRDREAALTGREREVLQLLSEGNTTADTAKELFLSPATVRSYAEAAMGKLGAANRSHAVAQALRLELIR